MSCQYVFIITTTTTATNTTNTTTAIKNNNNINIISYLSAISCNTASGTATHLSWTK